MAKKGVRIVLPRTRLAFGGRRIEFLCGIWPARLASWYTPRVFSTAKSRYACAKHDTNCCRYHSRDVTRSLVEKDTAVFEQAGAVGGRWEGPRACLVGHVRFDTYGSCIEECFRGTERRAVYWCTICTFCFFFSFFFLFVESSTTVRSYKWNTQHYPTNTDKKKWVRGIQSFTSGLADSLPPRSTNSWQLV